MADSKKIVYADSALKLTRLRLQEKLPALGFAFSIIGSKWTDERSGTDAGYLYWNPEQVISSFMESSEKLQRTYLHMILHGLYLHRFRGKDYPDKIWHLACDLLNEYRIDRMHVQGFDWPIPTARNRIYRQIRETGIPFCEKALAGWIQGMDTVRQEEIRRIFEVDDHAVWKQQISSGDSTLDGRKEIGPDEVRKSTELVHRWRTVFEQLELRDEEHRRQAGGSAGARMSQVVLEKEQGYDYRQFLKRFAVSQEELMVDMDSFDYIPYDYSRRMYENLVILEPLEYKEMQKLQEFVIAIDTSGSCSGEVVRQFLSETWEIFREKENFFQDMRIHLIQCDCLIQEHVCVTCEEEWKDYLEHLTVKGHGDTDFTPVFQLVDRMIQDGELKKLKGLLYFTDGDGIYPSEKPEYETAFVFLNEELRKGKAPDWALTLTLDKEVETRK